MTYAVPRVQAFESVNRTAKQGSGENVRRIALNSLWAHARRPHAFCHGRQPPIYCKIIRTRCSAIQTLLQLNSNTSTGCAFQELRCSGGKWREDAGGCGRTRDGRGENSAAISRKLILRVPIVLQQHATVRP